jgi:Cu2+-exporting ATPase
VRKDGKWSATLLVSGVHCPACIQKIESAMRARAGMAHARLNYSTKRLALEWTGQAEDLDSFIAGINALGYKAEPYSPEKAQVSDAQTARFLRLCLGVSGFAAGNIMLLSVGLWLTTTQIMGFATREFLGFIEALIAIPAVAFAGRPFFRSAAAVLRNGRTNMDVPISLALILTTGMSLFELARGAEHIYFDSAVMLMFFLLIGRYLDFLALSNARGAAGDLMSMMAGSATVIEDGRMKTRLIRDLQEGMTVQVAMGERIPADGSVISGQSSIDSSLVTGESVPLAVNPGEAVLSGTMNIAAPLTIKIARAAEDSMLAGIIRLMERAEQGQAKYVRIADRLARLYTPVVHVLAASAFLYWLLFGGMVWENALMVAVTVLIITCPCALGLAVPVVQVLSVGRLMRRGVMVKSGDALERLAAIDTVMLDKTGTLTLGHPVLQGEPQNLQLAASIAAHSRHPLSRALASAYQGSLLDMQVAEKPGQGLEAVYQGKTYRLGSRVWCGDASAPDRPEYQEIWLAGEGAAPQVFLFADTLRPDAKDVVTALRGRGLRVVLASGDRAAPVAAIAQMLGIDDARAGMKPDDKFAWLESLRAQGHKVLMIGDGLNDAPVLAGADVSVSPASGLDIARNAADIVFTGDKLSSVLGAYDDAVFTQTLVKENFALAMLYNVVAIPLAMMGHVTPMVAAIAMSSSSIVVIANSFRIKARP